MSASLVGSEMCIRDRMYIALVIVDNPAPRLAGTKDIQRECSLEQLGCNCCLLYTSDAADDM
eukprot:9772580-Alexandrium_andersonii.AAC.1